MNSPNQRPFRDRITTVGEPTDPADETRAIVEAIDDLADRVVRAIYETSVTP